MEHEMMEHSEILLYSDENGKEFVNVVFMDETFWLTQVGMAELFDSSKSNISEHLSHIFEEEELDKASCMRKFGISEFSTKPTNFYNLDAIIAVGYRVNSKKATRFRQWATKTLKEYIQKGFVLNDDLMKNGRPFGKDYFDELLERIREIRTSERRAYQKIADVFEQCSYDYDKNSDTTKAFYAFVQNKLHYAVTGKTAAELISERATLDSPTMGLTTWKGAPDGKILKSDTLVAKNYLNEKELSRLNRLVTMFIDYAELMAEDEQLMSMQDWLNETDQFLTNNRRKVLEGIHPDVTVVRDTEHRELTVDAVRALRQDVYIRPNEAARKVYIIADSHQLNERDQNVLLKIVEEGPAYAAFLFCAATAAALLPTVRSRCVEWKVAGQPETPEMEQARGLCRVLAQGKTLPAAQWLVSLENRRIKREQLQELLQDAWLLTAQALLLQAGKPKDGTLPEEAELLSRSLSSRRLEGLSALLRHYSPECADNVGAGHVLGALCAQWERLLHATR